LKCWFGASGDRMAKAALRDQSVWGVGVAVSGDARTAGVRTGGKADRGDGTCGTSGTPGEAREAAAAMLRGEALRGHRAAV